MTLTQRQDLAARIVRVIEDAYGIAGDTADVQSAIVHLLTEHEEHSALELGAEVRRRGLDELRARGDAPLTTDSSACTG